MVDTKVYPSSFKFIRKIFQDIIQDILDTDQSGRSSDNIYVRKTILFIDGSKLSVTEVEENGFLVYFSYDWYKRDKSLTMKFHLQEHEEEECQTETEPFHLHVPDTINPLITKRMPNFGLRDLVSVLENIRINIIMNQLTQLKNGTQKKKGKVK